MWNVRLRCHVQEPEIFVIVSRYLLFQGLYGWLEEGPRTCRFGFCKGHGGSAAHYNKLDECRVFDSV